MENNLCSDLVLANQILFSKLNIGFKNIKIENESVSYSACTFEIDKFNILYRKAKITPTKTGLFVTIWKRNSAGITIPFNAEDDIDLVIISCRKEEEFGQFVFPKTILVEKKIFTKNNIEGKRGIRVYPPWDIATNKQATKTQNWQVEYFLEIDAESNLERAKKLYKLKQKNEINPNTYSK